MPTPTEDVYLPDATPRGEGTVELFDTDGRCVRRERDHNFISKGLQFTYRLALSRLFTRRMDDSESSVPTLTVRDPFARMVLTDATHPEQPDSEWLTSGKVTGYAYTNGLYTAMTDTRRGSINTTESGFDPLTGRHRIVVDFLTSAGNGIIGSVYFQPVAGRTSEDPRGIFEPTTIMTGEEPHVRRLRLDTVPGGAIQALSMKQVNDQYYVLGRPMSYTASNIDHYIVYVFGADGSFIRTINIYYGSASSASYTIQDFEIHNGYVYASFDTSSLGVRRAPFDPASSEWRFPSASTERLAALNLLGLCRHDGKWFGLGAGSSSTGNPLYEFDDGFNLTATHTLGNPVYDYTATGGSLPYGLRSGSVQYLSTSQPNPLFSQDGALVTSFGQVNPTGSGYEFLERGGADLVVGFADGLMVTREGWFQPKHGISSRFRLPTPITKTSANTMKITYDFILPPLV